MSKYYFRENSFVIEDFDKAKTFSSFLPGIAGVKGIPMWTFYTNRGQGIVSFGIQDKNAPIMEFSPANISYRNVASAGFRTFIKNHSDGKIYEPFQSIEKNHHTIRKMYIRQNELVIEEINEQQGIKVEVTYFQIPQEDYAALARIVEITNLHNTPLDIEVLDGMPEILPFGTDTMGYKAVGNLLRSWMEVYNLENKIPYYKMRASTGDEAEISEVTRGHFYLSFTDEEKLISPIVDFELVFGQNTSLLFPDHFAEKTLEELGKSSQITANKVPCGFTGAARVLAPRESLQICTLIGHVSDIGRINEKAKQLVSLDYIRRKRREANLLIEELTKDIETKTASALFDGYCKQNYLDNFLRGGYPLIFENGKEDFVYHVYSRKHGDLERDYNFFSIAPEYYSQGNGNFRDANQNRRSDIFFNPEVGSFNAKMFMNLIQADGYNPLSVEGCTFEIEQKDKASLSDLVKKYVKQHPQEIEKLLGGKFTPGKLINYIADKKIELYAAEDEFLEEVLKISKQNVEASFGEGFWIDHWTYNMDLIDSYLEVYPDKLEAFVFQDHTYRFYDSPVFVLPRSEKYVLSGTKVRQYGSILEDEEKVHRLQMDSKGTNWLKTNQGKGEVYETNLFVKLLSLSLIKFATLDPYGMGVEMEANKPGWNDAMNGLPGLFGSGVGETFELKRIVQFLLQTAESVQDRQISLPIELYQLLVGIEAKLQAYQAGKLNDFEYWDAVAELREMYREQIRYGIEGEEQNIGLSRIKEIYGLFLGKMNQGIQKAYELGQGLYPTYFTFEAVAYEVVRDEEGREVISGYGLPKVKVKEFRPMSLPYFLEGPARALKTTDNIEEAKSIYEKVKGTDLYDQAIGMYKTSVSLDDQSHEIGRIRAFTPGWLERESIFLHMSYKYLLEVMKSGLHEEYCNEIQTSLIPFLEPEVYGRSTLENSSFLASSANPDPNVHGRGFVARLSGSTAEFLSMWRYMMFGKKVFYMDGDHLCLQFAPVLPAWLFDEKGQISARFLSQTDVVYHNPRKANTFGEDKARVEKMHLTDRNGLTKEIQGAVLTADYAKAVREGAMERIDVFMV